MKTSFIQFLLILVFFPCIFSTNIGPRAAKMADFMVCNDHTDSFTFFTAHWFYAILPNVPSDLPALLPPQKTFSWYQ